MWTNHVDPKYSEKEKIVFRIKQAKTLLCKCKLRGSSLIRGGGGILCRALFTKGCRFTSLSSPPLSKNWGNVQKHTTPQNFLWNIGFRINLVYVIYQVSMLQLQETRILSNWFEFEPLSVLQYWFRKTKNCWIICIFSNGALNHIVPRAGVKLATSL